MAHKTLIGGTAYEISGGRTLIGGTGYSIDKGKTLVGGTAYEIGFAVDIVANIIGSGINGKYTKATIGGVTYSNLVSGLIVHSGDIITLYVKSAGTRANIQVNGTTMASVKEGETSYDWTVPEGITEINIQFSYSSTNMTGTIRVTTS